MPKLIIKTGEKKGGVYRLGDKAVSIGRDASNNIVLPDRRISRVHACISPQGKDYMIEDMGSVNGVYVNNALVTKQALKIGDEIKLGATFIAFLSLDAPDELKGETDILQVKMLNEAETPEGMTVEMRISSDEVRPFESDFAEVDADTLKKAYQRLVTLYRISHDLGTIVDVPQLLNRILELVLDIMKADRSFIMLIDAETGELTLPVVRHKKGLEREEISISKTIIDQVIKSGESLLLSDAMKDDRFKDAQSIIFHGMRSTLCVPIKAKDKMLGIMHIDTKAKEVSFTKQDVELLTAISQQAAVALENAKLFEELKRANQELKTQQEQLIEAEKLSALGRLAGGVAHEINNPMTSILGYSELAAKKLASGGLTADEIKECAEFVTIVQDEAQQCRRIAQTLLQFGRRKKAEMAKVAVNDIIGAALAVAQFHIKKAPIEVKQELAEGLPQIMGDSGQLQQVFLNFIINARDAMEKGGTLTVASHLRDDTWVEVVFSDTGYGIPQEIQEEIFKPLYTTKAEGKGTGLGLSISQDIIERHKGTIELTSAPDHGTTFTIRLPVVTDPNTDK